MRCDWDLELQLGTKLDRVRAVEERRVTTWVFNRRRSARLLVPLAFAFAGAWHSLAVGCGHSPRPVARPTIDAVLARHQHELMAKPGVVGVYGGLMDDGVTSCLKVMLSRPDPKLERSLPRQLEGYRVIPEVTGEIVPMRSAPR